MSTSDERVREALLASTHTKDAAWFEKRLEETKIHIDVSLGEGLDLADRRIQARVTVNLLHRIFRHVSMSGAAIQDLFSPKTVLVHPLQVTNVVPSECDLVVRIGGMDATFPSQLHIDNRGWTAYLSTERPCDAPRETANPVGAYYAGVLGVSQCFNRVFQAAYDRAEIIEGTQTHDLVTFGTSGYNYEPRLDSAVILPKTAIVGVGSIGQALVDIFASLNDLRGDVWLIDHELTDESNESRYVLSFPSNRPSPKVAIARDRINGRHPLMRVIMNTPVRQVWTLETAMRWEVPGHLEGYHAEAMQKQVFPMMGYQAVRKIFGDQPFELAISCVDSEQTRRDIQMGLHKAVLNAWTDTASGRLGFAVGRHIFDRPFACLACIHHPEVLAREPNETEFAARVLGWPEEKVKKWVEDPSRRFDDSEIRKIAKSRMLTPDQVKQLSGKNLQELLHDEGCGLARLPGEDREPVAQVPHVSALAACHLATQTILHLLDHPEKISNLGVLDALAIPNEYGREASRTKAIGCLCGEPRFIDAYRRIWGSFCQ